MNPTEQWQREADIGPTVEIGTTCKFCKKPITLKIAKSYSELGDPQKLIPMAACNSCADLRVERRSLEAKVKFICMMRKTEGKKESDSQQQERREALEKLLKQYAHLVARWHFMEGMAWDDAALDTVMEKPGQWFDVLATLWKTFKAATPELL